MKASKNLSLIDRLDEFDEVHVVDDDFDVDDVVKETSMVLESVADMSVAKDSHKGFEVQESVDEGSIVSDGETEDVADSLEEEEEIVESVDDEIDELKKLQKDQEVFIKPTVGNSTGVVYESLFSDVYSGSGDLTANFKSDDIFYDNSESVVLNDNMETLEKVEAVKYDQGDILTHSISRLDYYGMLPRVGDPRRMEYIRIIVRGYEA